MVLLVYVAILLAFFLFSPIAGVKNNEDSVPLKDFPIEIKRAETRRLPGNVTSFTVEYKTYLPVNSIWFMNEDIPLTDTSSKNFWMITSEDNLHHNKTLFTTKSEEELRSTYINLHLSFFVWSVEVHMNTVEIQDFSEQIFSSMKYKTSMKDLGDRIAYAAPLYDIESNVAVKHMSFPSTIYTVKGFGKGEDYDLRSTGDWISVEKSDYKAISTRLRIIYESGTIFFMAISEDISPSDSFMALLPNGNFAFRPPLVYSRDVTNEYGETAQLHRCSVIGNVELRIEFEDDQSGNDISMIYVPNGINKDVYGLVRTNETLESFCIASQEDFNYWGRVLTQSSVRIRPV